MKMTAPVATRSRCVDARRQRRLGVVGRRLLGRRHRPVRAAAGAASPLVLGMLALGKDYGDQVDRRLEDGGEDDSAWRDDGARYQDQDEEDMGRGLFDDGWRPSARLRDLRQRRGTASAWAFSPAGVSSSGTGSAITSANMTVSAITTITCSPIRREDGSDLASPTLAASGQPAAMGRRAHRRGRTSGRSAAATAADYLQLRRSQPGVSPGCLCTRPSPWPRSARPPPGFVGWMHYGY